MPEKELCHGLMKTIWKGIDALARWCIGLIAKIAPGLGKKCLELWNNTELVSYLFVGLATTLVNYVCYWAVTRLFGLTVMPGTWVAWLVAVIFGYWANKTFVFKTHCPDLAALAKEAFGFFTMRLVSLGMETVLMYVTVSVLHLNDLVMKLVINLLVIILNYVFSKMIIFKKK